MAVTATAATETQLVAFSASRTRGHEVFDTVPLSFLRVAGLIIGLIIAGVEDGSVVGVDEPHVVASLSTL